MLNKNFKMVLLLAVLVILGIIFYKKFMPPITSVEEITTFNDPTSLKYYKKSCQYENAEVCNDLGDMYHLGTDLDIASINYAQAVKYYKKACELESGKGCNNLAYMLNKGKGIARNNWTAIRLYKKACKYEEMEACYNVGSMYFHGEGSKRDYYSAVVYFKKACKSGISAGCNDLGYMYEHAKYFRKDLNKAMSYYSDACEGGEAYGCSNLAYIKEKRGNLVSARQFYNIACDLGDTRSCNRVERVMGNYVYEIKSESELKKVAHACNRTSEGGGLCYKVGLYYEKTGKKDLAHTFFEKACARHHSQSCKHLGDLFRQ